MKTKTKKKYKLKDGTVVPGVTTIIKSQLAWNKEVLMNWANKIGRDGISMRRYVDDKADIGTLAHAFITDNYKGIKTNTDDYSKNQISSAENSVISYYQWEKDKKIEPILIEEPLVSEKLKYGGTPDIYCNLDGEYVLIDIKTGSGIYKDFFVQTSAYWNLIIENELLKPTKIIILNIPRSEDEMFSEQTLSGEMIDLYFEVFLNCLKNYYLKRKIEQFGKDDNKSNDEFYNWCKKVSDKNE